MKQKEDNNLLTVIWINFTEVNHQPETKAQVNITLPKSSPVLFQTKVGAQLEIRIRSG